MKKGLVLEGGGIRGIFSAGVMDVLMEEGIKFDGGIGVSAGAAFGCNYKSGQPRRAIRYNLKYAKDPRYSSVRSLLTTGDLFNAQFCYHDIPNKLYPFDWKAFRENPMEFYLVCTDVETGKPVYHLCGEENEWEMLEWFRASGSMPLVSRVVEIDGQKLLDTTTSAFPYRMGCTGITSEYGTLTMDYQVTITETIEEEVPVSEGEIPQEGNSGAAPAENNESQSGTKKVTRTVERTEDRTITRELTFTPEN